MSPTGTQHGDITNRLGFFLSRHVYENDLGKVFAAETGFCRGSEDGAAATVRAPDIAFVTRERAGTTSTTRFVPIAPDLAVETLSPDDRPAYVSEKVQRWLDNNTPLVWVGDPRSQSVVVHVRSRPPSTLGRDDTLTGGDVLPDFQLLLAELFE